jgi:hypothetical protein
LRIKGCRVVSAADLLRPQTQVSRPKPLLFLPSSSSIVLWRPSGPLSRPTTSQKIRKRPKSNSEPLTTRPQRRFTFFYMTYINSVRTSLETQYISVMYPGTLTTRPQRRSTFFYTTFTNSVRTSQETQYISVLQPGTLTKRDALQSTFRTTNT